MIGGGLFGVGYIHQSVEGMEVDRVGVVGHHNDEVGRWSLK